MVGFFFLCGNGTDEFDVGDIFESITEEVGFVHELDGVSAFYSSTHTLVKATEFVGGRCVPSLLEFGVPKEMVVFEGLSGFHIDDGVSEVMVPCMFAGGNAVIGDGYRPTTS